MADPPPLVGYRFRPTHEEIVDDYLRPKNLDSDSSHVDRVFNTLNISSFDPWELPAQSIMKSRDQIWYFFGRKENKYKRGNQQIRKTKSGFWKKTGKAVIIKRNREKIGEKWILVFHLVNKSKTKWVLHEYHLLSPSQMMMTYTVCKVKFKGEASEVSSPPPPPPRGGEIEIEHNNHSSITQINNNSGGSQVGTSIECPQSQEELENPPQLSGFLDVFEEPQLADTMRTAISNLSTDEWNSLLNDDEYEQRNVMFMQEDRNDHRPKKPLTGVLVAYSSDSDDDGDDYDSVSATTGSIQTSSTCDSFGSSNHHRVDHITNLQESPNSTIKLSQKVNQTPSQATEILGQEKTKNKRAGFFYRMIQRFIKKIQLCTSA